MATDDLYNPGNSPRSELDSDDDLDRAGPSRRKRAQKSKGKEAVNAWEGTYKRSWDQVQEDESGGIQAAVESLIARGRRKRYAWVSMDLTAARSSPRPRCAAPLCGTCSSSSTCRRACATRTFVRTGSS
jgi:hypothetical protein